MQATRVPSTHLPQTPNLWGKGTQKQTNSVLLLTHKFEQGKSGQGYQQKYPDGFARICYSLRATTRVTPSYGYLNKIHYKP